MPRLKRSKKYHKFVNFFRTVQKFHPPYRVLIDGNFLHKATKEGQDIRQQLSKILQDQPFLFMTKCVMRELENAGEEVLGKATLQKSRLIPKLTCKHSGGVLDPDECIWNYVGSKNESKTWVCTNDEDLRNKFRRSGNTPLFFFNHNVLVMDSPGEVSEQKF